MLTASCRPAEDLRGLRAYVRQRALGREHRAAHIPHLPQARQQRNVPWAQVVSAITGSTGRQILRALGAGARAPQGLAQVRPGRCHARQAEIAKALSGPYRPEPVLALQQARALYDFYTPQVQACAATLAQHYGAVKPSSDDTAPPPPLGPEPKPPAHAQNAPAFDVRGCVYRRVGVELTAVRGVEASPAQTILRESGTDMSKGPSEQPCASWLGLAPHTDLSGGKGLRRHPLKVRNRAAQALRLAAQALGRTQTALGAYYRRRRARQGPKAASTATAHKLARIVYPRLTQRDPYQPLSPEVDEHHLRQRELARLKRQAARLGFTLLPQPATAA